ncbi:MAG: outer membrane beta-barrel protein [Alphaproteobacteria bacterium]|nr:outer membrane beta-barrel protein [Alphaproteobacteria bacterium]
MAALRSGPYIGLSGGASIMRSKINQKMHHDTVFVSTLALGVRAGSIRLAGEMILNTKADYQKKDGKLSYEANALSLQGYYDVPVRSMIRPFFNVGVGMYGSTIKGEPDVDDSNDKMMWNVGAGFTFAVSRATSLDLGYRYLRFSKEKYKDGNKKQIPIETENHHIYAGWRYTF